MSNLLRSGIRRYTHSFIFWITVLMTIGLAVLCGYKARTYYVDPISILAAMITEAVMISWLVGREYEEGIFRNKVISGHSKGSIFVAELFLGVGISVILYLLFTAVFFSFNGYIWGHAPTEICIKLFVGGLLSNACVAALLVTISSLISYRAISVAVNMVLVFSILLATINIQSMLSEPEFVENPIESFESKDDNVTQDTARLTQNADYIEEPLRSVLTAAYRISPCVHIVEGFTLTYKWFGYDLPKRIDTLNEKGITWEGLADFSVTDDEKHNLSISILYTTVELILFCIAGYFAFRKKELK